MAAVALLSPCATCGRAGAQAFPDLDLQVSCPRQIAASADGVVTFEASVILRSEANGADEEVAVQAWSLSLRPTGAAAIVAATTDGTTIPPTFRTQGYEKTELTDGPGNQGAVSAVLLSLEERVSLPLTSETVILRLEVACPVPTAGCIDCGVAFSGGLIGSGQPIKNTLACGPVTRRDDGGPADNDADGYEDCAAILCRGFPFIRADADGNGEVSVTDALFLLGALFRGSDWPPCLQAADANADDQVNLTDVVHILEHLFRSGPPPEDPYPGCGLPSRPTTLDCAHPTSCGERGRPARG